MVDRRNFLKTAAAAGSAMALNPVRALGSRYQNSSGFFGVHSFVENHPDAVFIMRTNVDDLFNNEAKKQAGLDFSRSIIIPKETGVPLTHLIPIKPNIRIEHDVSVNVKARKPADSRVEGYKGTDACFVEGVIEGMKELGLSSDQFFIREVNGGSSGGSGDYPSMAERTGAEIRNMGDKVGVISENDLVWVDTPDGIWYRKIPYLWPINAPDTWLLNIGKFKAHSMGLTLNAKNLQGSIAKNYQEHCSAYTAKMDMDYTNHKNPAALADIKANFERHLADGVPRWDRPGDSTWNSGIGMETWASRCLDNNAATPVGLQILEGIYGIDGHFRTGPNPVEQYINDKNGESWEYMTNIIIFGMNAFHIDIVGHWLGGHEPGNLGLFHMSLENGMSKYLDPMNIPVYEWKNGEAVLTPLTDFEQTPLLTYYMQRNYNGQTENYWHLLDEPFDYGTVKVEEPDVSEKPESFVLNQNYPNPFNPNTSIEFSIPNGGHARLEVYNSNGQLINVLVDGYRAKGSHMAVWNTNNHSSGTYFYRFRFGGHSETRKMTLLK